MTTYYECFDCKNVVLDDERRVIYVEPDHVPYGERWVEMGGGEEYCCPKCESIELEPIQLTDPEEG